MRNAKTVYVLELEDKKLMKCRAVITKAKGTMYELVFSLLLGSTWQRTDSRRFLAFKDALEKAHAWRDASIVRGYVVTKDVTSGEGIEPSSLLPESPIVSKEEKADAAKFSRLMKSRKDGAQW